MAPLLLSMLLGLTPLVDPAHVEASVAAGAGYDSNLALAPDGSSQSSIGTATLSLWADAGWSMPLGVRSRLYAGLRFDGVICLDASDFTRQVPGGDLVLTHVFNSWLAGFVATSGGYAFYGDSARNGARLGGRAILRFRPSDPLSIRIGYARSQNWAADPVFSLGTDRLLASAEIQLASRTYLAAGYTFVAGDQVFYKAVSTLPPGRAVGHQGSGAFSTLVPYQANATEHILTLRFEQGFGRGLFVTMSYDHTRGSGDQGHYRVNSVSGALGYRF